MKVERSSYLNIRLDWMYSIYVLFVVAIILRYLWLFWEAVRGEGKVDATEVDGGAK
jgi:hypothetical protein